MTSRIRPGKEFVKLVRVSGVTAFQAGSLSFQEWSFPGANQINPYTLISTTAKTQQRHQQPIRKHSGNDHSGSCHPPPIPTYIHICSMCVPYWELYPTAVQYCSVSLFELSRPTNNILPRSYNLLVSPASNVNDPSLVYCVHEAVK